MQYHTFLKKCLKLTHTKLVVLSKHVGVDASNLSRFSNGHLLPNPATSNKFNEDLGEFFFNTIEKMEQKDEVLKELGIKNQQQLIDKFKRTFQNAYISQTPVFKFKEPEVLDYVGLMVELSDVISDLNITQCVVSLPPRLLTLIQTLPVDLVLVEMPISFIYIKNVVFYSLSPFEEFQKAATTRFSFPHQLRELDICLNLNEI